MVGLSTVAVADGTAGTIRLSIGCDQLRTTEYWQPFMIYIPASANVPLAELNRYRQQLLHGAVPANYNGPGIPATVDAIATSGYYLVNPSGGAPIPVLPASVVTGYSTDGGAGAGDTVAIAKGRFTKSNAGVCPNGTNGELTTSGCATALLPATATTLGGVKCDGTTTTCGADGTISASISGGSVLSTAGGQTLGAANTVTGLPSGCQQFPCVVAHGTETGLNASTNLTLCSACAAGTYLVTEYGYVTTAGTSGATMTLLLAWNDGYTSAGNTGEGTVATTTLSRYGFQQPLHLAAGQSISTNNNCTNGSVCNVDWIVTRLQ